MILFYEKSGGAFDVQLGPDEALLLSKAFGLPRKVGVLVNKHINSEESKEPSTMRGTIKTVLESQYPDRYIKDICFISTIEQRP